jgi:hypothetical protein
MPRLPARLLACGLAAGAGLVALSGPAAAEPCYPDKSLSYVGVCAYTICVDLCGPVVVVDPYCELERPALATCQAVDDRYYSTGQ